MTNDARRAAIKEMIKQHTQSVTTNRQTARDSLIREGFLLSNGKLAPAYGGHRKKAVKGR